MSKKWHITLSNGKTIIVYKSGLWGITANGIFFPGWHSIEAWYNQQILPVLDALKIEVVALEKRDVR